ncbi:MAG: SURF1 family protein [Steroidobacteraceae bacterium]
MSVKLGSRVFEPRAFTTLLALALVVALVSLGRWQLHRAEEKRALYALFDSGKDATRAIDAATPRLPRYQHVDAVGSYDPEHQILIDNMSNAEGRAGYYVVTPFALRGGGRILVNRGWVAVGASRAVKPEVAVSTQEREIRGRTDELPRAGMQLGERVPLAPPYPVVANFPTHAEIAALLRESRWAAAANLVLLDPSEPDGYVRQWQPPGFPPVRHIAYAVQWFSLAAALTVIYFVTNVRRAGRANA